MTTEERKTTIERCERGDRSPLVRALQQGLVHLGHSVGRAGVDGVFGGATTRAVKSFQRSANLVVDGIVGPKTVAALNGALLAFDAPRASRPAEPALPEGFIDRRGLHKAPRLYSKSRSPRSFVEGARRVIRGVTLHQTGIFVAERPKRWDTLNAHIGVLRSGEVILTNALEDFIWHAQGLSEATIGVEFNGRFPGVAEDDSALLTPEMLAAADRLFEWLKATFAAGGGRWTRVHAHRQSTSSRRGDPGSEIWQKVGQVWLSRLGPEASDGGPDFVLGSGRPIPRAWNPAYPSPY